MHITNLPNIGPYLWVSRDEYRTFENGRTFRFAIYGAKGQPHCWAAPEDNGIVIFDHDNREVITDQINQATSGYHGPTPIQVCGFGRLLTMTWADFQEFVAGHPRTRHEVE